MTPSFRYLSLKSWCHLWHHLFIPWSCWVFLPWHIALAILHSHGWHPSKFVGGGTREIARSRVKESMAQRLPLKPAAEQRVLPVHTAMHSFGAHDTFTTSLITWDYCIVKFQRISYLKQWYISWWSVWTTFALLMKRSQNGIKKLQKYSFTNKGFCKDRWDVPTQSIS